MLSHKEMVGLQAEKHWLINADDIATEEELVLHCIHTNAYLLAQHLATGKRVLDLGCNTGYGSEILSRSAKSVVGADVSEKAVAAAQSRYIRPGLTYQAIDGQVLPYERGAFDLVVSCQVLEHIVDHKQYMDEIKRVLALDGMVLFTTPNAAIRLDPGMKPWNEFHAREFNAVELEALLGNFFADVSVFGLYAREPYYSIERRRVSRARAAARNAARPERRFVRSVAKAIMPRALRQTLKAVAHSVSRAPSHAQVAAGPPPLDNALFYRRESLDDALDLLAVCSEAPGTASAAMSTAEAPRNVLGSVNLPS